MRRRLILTMTAVLAVVLTTTALVATRRNRHAGAPAPVPSTSSVIPVNPSPSAAPTAAPPATATPPVPRPTTPAPPGLPAGLRGRDIEVIPTSQRVVALTFDAGANAAGLPSILDTLRAERIPATFFLTGGFADRYPDAVRSIVAAGHRLGNHTATHPYCTGLSNAAITRELATAEAQIRAAGGTSTRPLFRFPYGDRDARTIAAVNDAGYVAVRWTVDTLGWQGTSGAITTQRIVDRVLGAARPGEIVLMHVGSHPTDRSTLDAQALPAVIATLRARGYAFVNLDALLGGSG
jgi:peptidoglycan/xylan/chitin deacetylase (PgdA/CDA1 family)